MVAILVAVGVGISSLFIGQQDNQNEITVAAIKITSSQSGKVTEVNEPFMSPKIFESKTQFKSMAL